MSKKKYVKALSNARISHFVRCAEIEKDLYSDVKYFTKKCEVCDKDFTTAYSDSRYCSYDCSSKYEDAGWKEVRKCIICGNDFITYKRYRDKTCSDTCKTQLKLSLAV